MNNNSENDTYTRFLSQIPPFYKEMTLDGIKALLHELGDFHESLKVIHIAGTNGKGSSVKMLSSVYNNAGYKVGTFTSPYIKDFRECIHISQSIIDISLMNLATLKVSKAYQELVNKNSPLPTHYECITVVALLAMYIEKVDLAIVEVLMGGLNDATNIFRAPLLTLITSISLDHTEYLGHSLELIAAQKAGIIKDNCPIVLNINSPSITGVVRETANSHHAPFYNSDTYIQKQYSKKDIANYFNHLNLKGHHQRDNLAGVLTCIDILQPFFNVSKAHILTGLKSVQHPCRLEAITKGQLNFVIDGSHNEEGILALINFIKENHTSEKLIFILGMLKDKDQQMIQEHIYSMANQVLLTIPNNSRQFDPYEFYDSLTKSRQSMTKVIPIIKDVYTYIQGNFDENSNALFIVCGSLYVSFPFRELIT